MNAFQAYLVADLAVEFVAGANPIVRTGVAHPVFLERRDALHAALPEIPAEHPNRSQALPLIMRQRETCYAAARHGGEHTRAR